VVRVADAYADRRNQPDRLQRAVEPRRRSFPAPEHGGRGTAVLLEMRRRVLKQLVERRIGSASMPTGAPVQLVVQPRLPGVATDRRRTSAIVLEKDQVRGGA